jgi:hypothetical protein
MEPAIVLRIPDSGGWPAADSGQARGLLLLRVTASQEPDPSVVRTSHGPSQRARSTSLVSLGLTHSALSRNRSVHYALLALFVVLSISYLWFWR